MQSVPVIVIALLMHMKIPLSESIGPNLGKLGTRCGGLVGQGDCVIEDITGKGGQCSERFDSLLKNVTIHGFKLSVDTCLEGHSKQENMLKEINSTLQDILNKLAQCEGYFGQILRTNDEIFQLQLSLMQVLLFTQSPDYNGTYYLLSKFRSFNKEQAQRICKQAGGTLATINDPQELKFISKFLESQRGDHFLFDDSLKCLKAKNDWDLPIVCDEVGQFLCEVKKKV